MAPCEEGTVSGGRLLKVGGVFSNQPASEARGCENTKIQTKSMCTKMHLQNCVKEAMVRVGIEGWGG